VASLTDAEVTQIAAGWMSFQRSILGFVILVLVIVLLVVVILKVQSKA